MGKYLINFNANWLAVKKWESDLAYLKHKYTSKHIGTWKGKIKYYEISDSTMKK